TAASPSMAARKVKSSAAAGRNRTSFTGSVQQFGELGDEPLPARHSCRSARARRRTVVAGMRLACSAVANAYRPNRLSVGGATQTPSTRDPWQAWLVAA